MTNNVHVIRKLTTIKTQH